MLLPPKATAKRQFEPHSVPVLRPNACALCHETIAGWDPRVEPPGITDRASPSRHLAMLMQLQTVRPDVERVRASAALLKRLPYGAQIALLAASYFVAAKLSLLLAI